MTRLRRFLRPVALLCLGAFAAGCYSYVPVASPAPGSTVRIRLPVRAAVEGSAPSQRTLDVEGRILAAGDSLILETTTQRELGTFRVLTETDTLRVARGGMVSLEERVFSRSKTMGLTVLIAAGATGLVLAALEAAGGQRGGERPGSGSLPAALLLPPLLLKNTHGEPGRR